ncbi:MAG TPA: hypothetical protein VFC57_01670, partial [Aeromicrobium sp.]|nr:hypothetical protein [Aeromicrobium sp.]
SRQIALPLSEQASPDPCPLTAAGIRRHGHAVGTCCDYGPTTTLARRRSRVTDASVVETVVVLTVAQVSDGLSAVVAAVVDDTDDGYIKWTVFPSMN